MLEDTASVNHGICRTTIYYTLFDGNEKKESQMIQSCKQAQAERTKRKKAVNISAGGPVGRFVVALGGELAGFRAIGKHDPYLARAAAGGFKDDVAAIGSPTGALVAAASRVISRMAREATSMM